MILKKIGEIIKEFQVKQFILSSVQARLERVKLFEKNHAMRTRFQLI